MDDLSLRYSICTRRDPALIDNSSVTAEYERLENEIRNQYRIDRERVEIEKAQRDAAQRGNQVSTDRLETDKLRERAANIGLDKLMTEMDGLLATSTSTATTPAASRPQGVSLVPSNNPLPGDLKNAAQMYPVLSEHAPPGQSAVRAGGLPHAMPSGPKVSAGFIPSFADRPTMDLDALEHAPAPAERREAPGRLDPIVTERVYKHEGGDVPGESVETRINSVLQWLDHTQEEVTFW